MRGVIGLFVSVVVAALVLVLDPLGWWWDDAREADEQYERLLEADMRDAVEGTWSLVLKKNTGEARVKFVIVQAFRDIEPVTFHRPERGLIRSAAACGQTTLVRSAAAC